MAERGLPRPAPGPNRTHPRGRCRHTPGNPGQGARSPIHHPQRLPGPCSLCAFRCAAPCHASRRTGRLAPHQGAGHRPFACPDSARCDGIHGATRRPRTFATPFRSALNNRGLPRIRPHVCARFAHATPTRPTADTRRGPDDQHADHHDSEDPHGTPPGRNSGPACSPPRWRCSPSPTWPDRGRGGDCRYQCRRRGKPGRQAPMPNTASRSS